MYGCIVYLLIHSLSYVLFDLSIFLPKHLSSISHLCALWSWDNVDGNLTLDIEDRSSNNSTMLNGIKLQPSV